MSFIRTCRHHLSLLALSSALALSACGDDGDGGGGDANTNTGQPDARTGGSIDSGPGAPDAMTGLPACANAQASYTATGSVEVVEFFGPNVSLIFAGDDVAVVFPSGAEYDVGDFDLSAESEWTVTFCVDYDDNNSTCGADLVPESGTLKITTLTDQSIAGELVDAVFVDDADSPTCQTSVSVSFDEARPQ